MLFLDDFLEMLEELPAELKERGEEIRRLDGDVEMRLKRNREAINDFFERTGVSMSDEQRTERFNVLKDEYSKIRKMSEKKIEIATKMQDLLTKYQNHLEKEKTNFQCEMEADNSGVTETIEKRYTEYVESLLAARKERKRRHRGGTSSRDGAATASGALTKESSEKINRILQEGSRLGMDVSDDSASQSPASSAVPSPAPRGRPPKNGSNLMFSSALLPNDDYSAPSPTIRRKSTANGARGGSSIGNGLNNLNSSSSRVSPNVSEKSWSNHGADESVTPQTPSFTVTTPQTQVHPGAFVGSESRHGRPRKLTSRVQEMFKETLQRQRNHGNSMMSLQDRMQSMQAPPPTLPPLPPPPPNQPPPIEHEDGSSDDDEDGEDSRRWCFCNEKSYGEMVACDNKGCPYMWFHYPCVGVMAPPKGKWYCPHCTGTNLVGSNPTEDGLFIPSTSSALPDDL